MQLARRLALAAFAGMGGASLACGSPTGTDGTPSIVTSVAIDPPSSTLVVGAAAPLTAVVQDANRQSASGVTVLWTVKDAGVASISQTGLVTGRAVGSTQVAASVNGVSAIASITVRLAPVASVLIQPDTRALVLGQSAILTATPRDANGLALTGRAVAWASSNAAVVSVAPTGVVTANAVGAATITATSEGVSAIATVTVSPVPVGSLAIVPSSATVTVGQTAALAPTVKDANGLTVTDRVVAWSSSDDRIAIVSTAGVVRGIAPGSAVISATSEGVTGTAAVTVVTVPVGSVTVLPTSATVQRGATTILTATVKDVAGVVVTDRQVAWSTNNTLVASVSGAGVVTANAIGTATITASSGGKSGSAVITVVTVQPAVSFVVVTPGLVLVRNPGTVQLSAAAYDANDNRIFGRVVTWSSDDQALATVDANGLVTTKKAGTVQITATIDGKSDSSIILVTN